MRFEPRTYEESLGAVKNPRIILRRKFKFPYVVLCISADPAGRYVHDRDGLDDTRSELYGGKRNM